MNYQKPDYYSCSATARRDCLKQWLLAAVVVAVVFLAAALVSDPTDEERAACAFYPSAPSHAQQVAYREDAREQLRLQTIARGGL